TRTCLDGASCSFTCSGGDCTFRCAESANCVTSCDGGGCVEMEAEIPDAVETCGALCDFAPNLIEPELRCVRTVLADFEYDVDGSAACGEGATEFGATCSACVQTLEVEDGQCALAFESCLGRVDV